MSSSVCLSLQRLQSFRLFSQSRRWLSFQSQEHSNLKYSTSRSPSGRCLVSLTPSPLSITNDMHAIDIDIDIGLSSMRDTNNMASSISARLLQRQQRNKVAAGSREPNKGRVISSPISRVGSRSRAVITAYDADHDAACATLPCAHLEIICGWFG